MHEYSGPQQGPLPDPPGDPEVEEDNPVNPVVEAETPKREPSAPGLRLAARR